jgi:hypothetical protein
VDGSQVFEVVSDVVEGALRVRAGVDDDLLLTQQGDLLERF